MEAEIPVAKNLGSVMVQHWTVRGRHTGQFNPAHEWF
jgi:hypothetical protein